MHAAPPAPRSPRAPSDPPWTVARWLGKLPAALLVALLTPSAAWSANTGGLMLHVPSPDWRDQIVYFVVTDRFDDGNSRNNDQGAGEFNPRSNAHYSGGDLSGLQRRLDYIRGLGATAVWITPPVANQWWDGRAQYSGYHGYWAENFSAVDRHLGSLDDYRALSHALHSAGMYLVQDIVVNHTGNFFGYGPGWSASDPARGYQPNTGSRPLAAPSQAPFNLNDPRLPAHRAAGIYHWTPDVRDFAQPQQVLGWQMAGLDDLNTENPQVRRALRQSYGHWLREVGVDAFRVDTAFYVPPDFFNDFLNSSDAAAPGISRVAHQTGRDRFWTFGEGFAIDKPFAESEARRIERYVRSPGGSAHLTGMLNFPLYGSLGDVLARGAPTAVLGHRIRSMMAVHSAPHLMATFVDNHDVDRFLAGGSPAGLRQALLAIMTLPGVPVIYYGTEQGFTAQRGAMFAAGFGSGGQDHFDTQAPLYQLLQRLTALRRANPLFSRGVPTVLQTRATGPGVIAWRMQHGSESALVVLNTAESPVLLHGLATGLPPGVTLPGLLALDGAEPSVLRTGAGGRVQAVLPPRSGQVWRLPTANAVSTASTASPALPASPASPAGPALSLAPPQVAVEGQRLTVTGRAPAGSTPRLLIDADLAQATPTQADAQGRWSAQVDISRVAEGSAAHQIVAWLPGQPAAAVARDFRVRRPWTLLAQADDPAGDDQGPDGRYRYPSDAGWGANRQMDLRQVRVWRAGDALKIEIGLHRLTRSWNPPNGFDHVALTLFFSQPGRDDGLRELPQQQALMPAGLRWQHRLRVGGWANALYSAEGASASSEGTVLTPGAALTVDAARNTVVLTLPAGALGPAAALAGLKIYITTWDHDGGYRALAPDASGYTPGGGPAAGAKVMDDLLVTLP